MRLTVLGGCGAWPEPGQACSGFLLEHDGFRLLIDAGYATLPRLLQLIRPGLVDAVLISHGHPDHCADLNPLLRARVLGESGLPPLPLHAPAGALDKVLALDGPQMYAGAWSAHEVGAGTRTVIGPFRLRSWMLPHWVPNAGVRLTADGQTLAYTGDCGQDPQLTELAEGADLLVAEATYTDDVPDDERAYLSSARQAGQLAARAGAGRLLLTHLWPGTSRGAAVAAAADGYPGPVSVALPGRRLDLAGG
jgi:ribonuclease BN (tRNA processing enzyme)